MLDLYLGRGLRLYRTHKYEQAAITFQKVLKHTTANDNPKGIIYALLALGDCNFYLLHIEEAMTNFERARTITKQIKDKNTQALSQVNLGKCLLLKGGHSTQARYLLMEAIQIFDELEDDLGLLYAYSISGALEVIQGNREAAKEYFERGLIQAQLVGKKQLQDYFNRRLKEKRGEEIPFPYIYYHPYPMGPPAASAEDILKRIPCPSCQEIVPDGTKICPFCGYRFVE